MEAKHHAATRLRSSRRPEKLSQTIPALPDVTPPRLIVEPAELRFTGNLSFLGKQTPVTLSLYLDRSHLIAALLDLIQRPDDIYEELATVDPQGQLDFGELSRADLDADLAPCQPTPITLDAIDAEPDNARRWQMLAERFPDLFHADDRAPQGKPPATFKDIQKLTAPGEQARDPKSDLRKLLPHLPQIIGKNGQANKSEIARLLNLPAGGGSTWPYIKKLATALEKHWQRHAKRATPPGEGKEAA